MINEDTITSQFSVIIAYLRELNNKKRQKMSARTTYEKNANT